MDEIPVAASGSPLVGVLVVVIIAGFVVWKTGAWRKAAAWWQAWRSSRKS